MSSAIPENVVSLVLEMDDEITRAEGAAKGLTGTLNTLGTGPGLGEVPIDLAEACERQVMSIRARWNKLYEAVTGDSTEAAEPEPIKAKLPNGLDLEELIRDIQTGTEAVYVEVLECVTNRHLCWLADMAQQQAKTLVKTWEAAFKADFGESGEGAS